MLNGITFKSRHIKSLVSTLHNNDILQRNLIFTSFFTLKYRINLTYHEINVDKKIQGYRRDNKVQNGNSKKGQCWL